MLGHGRHDRREPRLRRAWRCCCVALIVWMINWMFRMSVESNRDREREEEAREYFDAPRPLAR